jgi:hypothetical protein
VSFTTNTFKHCSIRNWSTVNNGAALYLEGTTGWEIDKGNYLLAFTGPAVRIRSESATRTSGLILKGLFETIFAPGLDYALEIQVTSATASALYNCDIDFNIPSAKTAIVKLSEPSGGTPGTLAMHGTLRIINSSLGVATLFSAPQMTYVGDIHCGSSLIMNFGNLAAAIGTIYTDNKANLVIPVGSNVNNLVICDRTSGNLSFVSNAPVFHCMSTAETSGSLVFARGIGQADRSSEISVFNSSAIGNNNIKLRVHNATLGQKTDVVTARGDGRVFLGDITTQNILNAGGSASGSDVLLQASGIDANINISINAKGSGGIVLNNDVRMSKTITTTGTTGAQTINKTSGSVNFAAGATSLVVTNNLVASGSIVTCQVASNDSTMRSVVVTQAAGSFAITANAAPTAETRVNFLVIN